MCLAGVRTAERELSLEATEARTLAKWLAVLAEGAVPMPYCSLCACMYACCLSLYLSVSRPSKHEFHYGLSLRAAVNECAL